MISMLKEAKKALEESKVISFPTETVMGLGVFFDDYQAYLRLNEIKRRPEDKPYTLMLSSTDDISKYAHISKQAEKIIEAFMPGPVTLLLKSKENVPGYVTHNTGVIGVRVPDMPLINELIAFVGKPLLVPSANRSGEKPFTKAIDVKNEFKDELGYIVMEDALGEKPSTIIDLTGEDVKIIREGPISLKDIERIMKQ